MAADNNFSLATQFAINRIDIDGEDIIGLFSSLSIYENIYSPLIAGSIVIMDSDYANFTAPNENNDQKGIEGVEPIKFEFTNANDETLEFEGALNGLRNKTIWQQNIMYTFDFTATELRKNEGTFITKKVDNERPEDVLRKLIEEKLEGEIDEGSHAGGT